MKKLLALAASVSVLVAAAAGISFSEAFFQDTKTTPQLISTEAPARWLHLYSQPTDPLGLTDYALRASAPAPVAQGVDDGLTVDVGHNPGPGAWPHFDRAFVIEAPDPFPDPAVTEIEVQSAVENDGGAPSKPLQQVHLATLDDTQRTPSVTLAAGERRQVDLQVSTAGLADGIRLHSVVVLTVHLADGSQFEYRVPVDVCTGELACP